MIARLKTVRTFANAVRKYSKQYGYRREKRKATKRSTRKHT